MCKYALLLWVLVLFKHSCLHTSKERSHTTIITWKQNETTNNNDDAAAVAADDDDDVVLLLFDCTRVQIVSGFDMKNKSVQIWWRQRCCRSTLSFKVTWWISFLVQFHFQFSKFYFVRFVFILFFYFFLIGRRSLALSTHIAHRITFNVFFSLLFAVEWLSPLAVCTQSAVTRGISVVCSSAACADCFWWFFCFCASLPLRCGDSHWCWCPIKCVCAARCGETGEMSKWTAYGIFGKRHASRVTQLCIECDRKMCA